MSKNVVTTVLDRANRPIYVDSRDNVNGVMVEVQRPYGCLAVRVDRDGTVTIEAQDGEGQILDTHEIDPDQHVHPPADKESHDFGNSSGG